MFVGDGSANLFLELEIASVGQERPLQFHPYDKMSDSWCLMYSSFDYLLNRKIEKSFYKKVIIST